MNHASIMIRCITSDSSDISKYLFVALEEYIHIHWPQSFLTFRHEELYWKYPNTRDIVYNFFSQENNSVHNLIQFINITWSYSSFQGYNADTKCTENIEEAIWNRNQYPEEVFLLSDVEWVHIYTWRE